MVVPDATLIDLIGIFAGGLVLSAFIPQVIKAYRRKRMQDVSMLLMVFISVGMFLWVVYGIARSDLVIIGANTTGMALNLTLIGMKLKYDKLQ
ncbi:MAG: SemiSWEET family transporter [Nitrososphaerales archaeon]